jgi:DNA-binding CsgD family transcriptional regulator
MPWEVRTTILSDVESEVERMRDVGLTHLQIAKRLSVSRSTVRSYALRAKKKREAASNICQGDSA